MLERSNISFWINQIETNKSKNHKLLSKLESYRAVKDLLESQLYFCIDDLKELLPKYSYATLSAHVRFLVDVKVLERFTLSGTDKKIFFILPKNKQYLEGVRLFKSDLLKIKEYVKCFKQSKEATTKSNYLYFIEQKLNKLIPQDINNMELK